MNKFFAKLAGGISLVALVAGAGVAVASGVNAKGVKAADDIELSFDFSSPVTGWPTAATSAGSYTYTVDDETYTFALGANVYCNSSYLMLKYTTSLGLPAISDYKLTKIVAGNSSGCSTSTRVGVSSSSSSASYVAGGAYQTWGTQSSSYTYNLTESEADTVYYLYITNKNCQIVSLNLTYTYVNSGCTHDWVAGTVHPATCTEQGYTEYECSLCGETKQDDIVPATGHDWGEWEEVTAPTCLEAGEEQRVCANDNTHVESQPIAALGHNYVDGICTRCGAEEPSETTVGYVFSEHYSADTVIENESIELDEAISVLFVKRSGGTDTKYYTSGTAARWYGGGTLTISSSSGNIQSIDIEFLAKHDNSISADVGSYSDSSAATGTGKWVGDSKTVVFSQAGTSGHARISELTVTYDNGGTPAVTYTITYIANAADAEGSMSPTTAAAPEVASCAFTREGYEFARWNTQADGEGDNYAVGTTVSEDLTLYVIWQEYVPPIEGNVSMEGVTSASAVTVNGHPALKCGAGSTAGVMKLILNKADITKIKVYVAGWKGDTSKTVNVAVTSGTATIDKESITITEDSAITGTATAFTLNGAETTYVFTFDLVGASFGDEITFTAAQASKNRFVAWGATDLFAEYFANEFNSNLVCDASGEDSPSFKTGYDWTVFNGIYNGLDAQEQGRLHDADAVEGGSDIEDAMARYDYIEGKYNPDDSESSPWMNFIVRTVKPIENGRIVPVSNFADNSNSAMIIITVIALTSISSIAVLLVIKRRKAIR